MNPCNLQGAVRQATLALSACLLATAALAAPLDDMVAFDAAYIPALSLTNAAHADTRAAPRARAAMEALQQRWLDDHRRLRGAFASDVRWGQALERVGQQIRKAQDLAVTGDFAAAHEALEPVRQDLLEGRQRNGMSYFIDRLTAFHEPMEALTLATKGKRAEQLDSTVQAEIERQYVHAAVLWRHIEVETPAAGSYGLDAARHAQMQGALQAEASALSRLSDAVRAADPNAQIKAVQALKPAFSKLFTAFGVTR